MTTLAAYKQKDQVNLIHICVILSLGYNVLVLCFQIIAAVENHRVVIIDGFTGCGKTTQVCASDFKLIYEDDMMKKEN